MSLPGDRRLDEIVAELKHDLAKYVAWRSANYGADAWEGSMTSEFVSALQADILHTRGERPAWAVWDDALTQLEGRAVGESELDRVETAVERLRGLDAILRRGDPEELASHRQTIRDAQQTIRGELARLHRRLREG